LDYKFKQACLDYLTWKINSKHRTIFPKIIPEKGAKCRSLMVSARILNVLKPALSPETVEKGSFGGHIFRTLLYLILLGFFKYSFNE